jgi:hypothetical protein
MRKELKIVALPDRTSGLEPNCLFKSVRMFFGIWLDFEYMKENTYENECRPYHIYIYENDKYGYEEGDLIYTTNIPLETVKQIYKDLSDQKGYDWCIMVEGNENQYKPCEIYGKVVASSDLELCQKHGLNYLGIDYLKSFVDTNGNVDVVRGRLGKGYGFIPNDYENTNNTILTVDVWDRLDLSYEDYNKMQRSHITLGWSDDSKGYDVVLKNRYGKNGTIYSWEDIEQIKKEAFEAGQQAVIDRTEENENLYDDN